MKIKINKLFFIFFMCLISFTLFSCKSDEEEKTGYDGREFDISVKQDKSIIAKTVKVGHNFELTITGTGEAKTYDKKELVPWNAISKKITSVKIDEGIENIGNYYFFSCTLDKYIIPASVIEIEENSFNANAVIYSYSKSSIDAKCENTVYLYSEYQPTVSGKHWHMVGEETIIWDKFKILFIGNSFTFYPNPPFNDSNPGVCYLFKEIGTNLGLDLQVDFVTKGAHTLTKFADANDEKGKIVDQLLKASSDYDYVILQEQSVAPVNGYNAFSNGVKALKQKIDQTQDKAKIYLYATWGFPAGIGTNKEFISVSTMEKLIRDAYIQCAADNGVLVSHAGKAYTEVYENHKEINLFGGDDKHQSYAGAYLSACVHLSTIFGLDVRNTTFTGEISTEVADVLQSVAYEIGLNKK